MNEPNELETSPKFTRGEKCILAHLALTIGVIIVLILVYLIHIFVVDHSGSSSAFETRRTFLPSEYGLDEFPVGILYYVTGTRRKHICNTFLLTEYWSISSGHCVAMRSDPDLSHLLHDWRIKYAFDHAGTKILRSVVHPHFNRDTFTNNIGLLQHGPGSRITGYKIPKINDNYGHMEAEKIKIISWDHGSKGVIFLRFHTPNLSGHLSDNDKIEAYSVRAMAMENCTSYVASIIELRTYEFCIVLKKKTNTTLGHGAIIVDPNGSTAFGIFTWGERQQKFLPMIVLSLSHFKKWINSILHSTALNRYMDMIV